MNASLFLKLFLLTVLVSSFAAAQGQAPLNKDILAEEVRAEFLHSWNAFVVQH